MKLLKLSIATGGAGIAAEGEPQSDAYSCGTQTLSWVFDLTLW